jgi:hypothetical protein
VSCYGLLTTAADVVPEYNESKPEEMAMDIDRKVSFLRSQSIDPRFDRSRPEAERMQFMPDAPAADSQYNSLGMEGFHNSSNGPRGSNGAPAVEWLPYSNVREKLESWVQPGASNDVGSGRNLMKQFSKDERT